MYLPTENVGLKERQCQYFKNWVQTVKQTRQLLKMSCPHSLSSQESFINLLCFQGLYSLLPSGLLPSGIELGEILA